VRSNRCHILHYSASITITLRSRLFTCRQFWFSKYWRGECPSRR